MKEQPSGKITKKRRKLHPKMEANKWQPGQSGNPKGRPKERYSVQDIRKLLGKDVGAIIEAGRKKAMEGHFEWGRYLIDKVGPGTPKDAPLPPIKVAGSLLEQGQEVIASAANGEMSAADMTAWFKSLSTYFQLVESEELTERIEAIEVAVGLTSEGATDTDDSPDVAENSDGKND